MNKIEKIAIENIKGIDNLVLNFDDLYANKVNILVAPNGFGKSTLACAFKSLKPTKLDLSKDDKHKNMNQPSLQIKFGSKNLIANNSENSFNKTINIAVINNAIKAKSSFSTSGANLVVNEIVLYKNIPKKPKDPVFLNKESNIFENKNIKKLNKLDFNNEVFIKDLSSCLTYINKINGKNILKAIENLIEEINNGLNKKTCIKKVITDSQELDYFLNDKKIKVIKDLFKNEEDYISVINILFLLKLNQYDKNYLKDKVKYQLYLLYKEEVKEILKDFNTTKRSINPIKDKEKLIVKFPLANKISNGERDLLFFIVNLIKFKYDFDKESGILIIDEVFDYLDGQNLLVAQYYLSKYIDTFKSQNKIFYPIILTHLDPYVFNSYYFKKFKIHFLKDYAGKQTKDDMYNFIIHREEEKLKEDISKYFLHYHPDQKILQFNICYLNENYLDSIKFKKIIYEEISNYLNNKSYNILKVIAAIRVKIEENIYNMLKKEEKDEFLNKKSTKCKIEYVENLGYNIEDKYKFLCPIYNEGLHINENNRKRVLNSMAIKLDNFLVLKLVREIFIELD